MNNAINRSIVDNGDVNTWYPERKGNTYQEDLNFLKTYILPYIKYNRYEIKSNRVFVYLLDGGLVVYHTDVHGTDVIYWINGKCEINPRNKFQFAFNKTGMSNLTFIEPYTWAWNGQYNTLKTSNTFSFGCKKGCTNCAYCTKILQLNDWKFPDDYPW